jgi:hypothetical protein
MGVPVACSLTQGAARAQLEEWREILAETVTAADRVSPAGLALRLRDDLRGVRGLLLLARREQACCPFFEFALQVKADGVTLLIDVPDEAAPVLDQFAGLFG